MHEDVRLTGLTSTFLGYGVWMLFGVVAVAGYSTGRLVELARARGWAERELLPIATLAVPLLCY